MTSSVSSQPESATTFLNSTEYPDMPHESYQSREEALGSLPPPDRLVTSHLRDQIIKRQTMARLTFSYHCAVGEGLLLKN